ncbi:LacI family DNA-binding transcriptional regulator [Mycolicibacterium sp.]|uniref:LacI family DNA-binding transcriptional regulator n=1 Tax=Mycolicibacterium sp. TaxID=2320850 RepID=UPI003D0FBB0A
MSRPTLRDVAQAAGVHAATVSRALNPATQAQVNPATAKRVLKAAKALGYRPNPIARSLKTSRSGTVGMVIPDIANPLFPPMVRGLESVLEPNGYNCWVVSTDNDACRQADLVAALQSNHVDGFVLATAKVDDPLLQKLHDEGAKVVLVNRRTRNLPIPSVVADDAAGISLAVAHLKHLGHTRIAHLAGPQNTSTGADRSTAFRHAIRDQSLEEDPQLVVECADWREQFGAEALRTLLDRGAEFTAVVAGNDLIALGCYDVFAETGLRCPEDISVIGFNDMMFMDKVQPPLTSVRLPHREVGAEAGRLLVEMLNSGIDDGRSILLPVELVVRGSTAAPPGGPAPRSGR